MTPTSDVAPVDMAHEFGKSAYSYWGEEVAIAYPISLDQILPGLPPREATGVVDLLDVVDPRMAKQLRDPASLLLAQDEWPPSPPRAATMLAPGQEWIALARELFTRGICHFVPEGDVFAPRGIPLVNGLFGVTKGKELEDGRPILRLICNFVPINSYLHTIRGAVDDLPYIVQWGAIALAGDEHIRVSQEDMTAAFYLFRMPRATEDFTLDMLLMCPRSNLSSRPDKAR